MDECFRILNQQSEHIRFTREKPTNGWLPFLNAQIKLSGRSVSVKWYRKESSKNILINARSAHPSAVKNSVVRNMFRTAIQMCTGDEEREQSRRLASNIAAMNGYDLHHSNRRPRHPRSVVESSRKIPLCLPFISDKVSAVVKQSIARAQLNDDIILVNIPSRNIKKRLVRNRLYDKYCTSNQCIICPYGNIGDCTKAGVIYQLECLLCNATYIGETGRSLGVRVKEHLASKRRGSLISALGRHKQEAHGGNDYNVKCTILAYEPEISARKALEAFWIASKNPEMNNRNECLSITNDFMPFLPLCEL